MSEHEAGAPRQLDAGAEAAVVHVTLGKANQDRANGVSVAVHQFAAGLAEIRAEVEVWGITATPEEPTPPRPYPLRLFPATRSRFRLAPELRRALEQLPAGTLLHLHGGLLPEMWAVARLASARGLPFVLTPHGCYAARALRHNRWRKALYRGLFDRSVLEGAALLHGVGTDSLNGLRSPRMQSKAVTIPNGYEVGEPPSPAETAELIVTYCGRLSPPKGVHELVAGFALVAGELPDLHLRMVGDGPARSSLEAEVGRAGLSGRVHFTGALFGEEKRAALRASAGFALTSHHEGFPMALLEAAALGLPLLVSPGTGFTERVSRWGCGVNVGSTEPRDVADALRRLARQSAADRRAMGEQARRMMEEELDRRIVAWRLEAELYARARGGQP